MRATFYRRSTRCSMHATFAGRRCPVSASRLAISFCATPRRDRKHEPQQPPGGSIGESRAYSNVRAPTRRRRWRLSHAIFGFGGQRERAFERYLDAANAAARVMPARAVISRPRTERCQKQRRAARGSASRCHHRQRSNWRSERNLCTRRRCIYCGNRRVPTIRVASKRCARASTIALSPSTVKGRPRTSKKRCSPSRSRTQNPDELRRSCRNLGHLHFMQGDSRSERWRRSRKPSRSPTRMTRAPSTSAPRK